MNGIMELAKEYYQLLHEEGKLAFRHLLDEGLLPECCDEYDPQNNEFDN